MTLFACMLAFLGESLDFLLSEQKDLEMIEKSKDYSINGLVNNDVLDEILYYQLCKTHP